MSESQGAAVTSQVYSVLTFDQIRDIDFPLVGAKCARLARLSQSGLPVPAGCCITTSALARFLAETGLRETASQSTSPESGSSVTIRTKILEKEMPEKLSSEIRTAYRALGAGDVAVRSSAASEDSNQHSFAGQYDTYLNVRGEEAVLDAVRKCWASYWSDRAGIYRAGARPALEPDMAVLIQTMVPAEVAGVLFTADPVSGNNNHIVIESSWGLGEGVVSGRVTTDSFVVEKGTQTIASRQIRYKLMMAAGAGDQLEKVALAQRDAASLTDPQILALTAYALRVRDFYNSEQDIEWAVSGGKIYILQARPITTLSVERPRTAEVKDRAIEQRTLWSRMDIGEIFCGLMTPLGISFSRYYQYHVHRSCAASLGILDTGDADHYMRYVNGYVFLNVSYTAYLLSQCPPTRDQSKFTIRFASEEVDLGKYANPYGTHPAGWAGARASLHWMKCTVVEMATMRKRAKRMVEARTREFDRFQSLDLNGMTRAQLGTELERQLEFFRAMCEGYMPYYINAFGFYGLLVELCRKWLGEEGLKVPAKLKGTMSNLRTVEAVRDIWHVAERVKSDPAILAMFRDTPVAALTGQLKGDAHGREFWQRVMEPFLRTNGVRGRQEMELTHPRWIDDPTYVYQMIRKYLTDGVAIDSVIAEGHQKRDRDADAQLEKMSGWQRGIIDHFMGQYSTCSQLRETTRMSMICAIWFVRKIVYELGRRLVEQGTLRSLEEVAFLDLSGIQDYLCGRKSLEEAFPRAQIEKQQRLHFNNLRLPDPPLSYIGIYDPSDRIQCDLSTEVIEGLAASPGRATGKARVIHDLVEQAEEFQPGEVLVTHFTDASWTPLFAIASAVITDIGSMLSHSSIVSRELGIPAVVNCRLATQVIRTGDTVVVDGEQGSVNIQRASAQRA